MNLPDGTLAWYEMQKVMKEEKLKELIEGKDEMIGRIFQRKVPGYGEHFGVVVKQTNSHKFQIIYDDYKNTERIKTLSRSQISKGIIPEGTGLHHVQEALDTYKKEQAEAEKLHQAAVGRYSIHEAHNAKIRRGELHAESAQVLLGVDDHAGSMPIWAALDRATEFLKPSLRNIASLAHNLLATNGKDFSFIRHNAFCGAAQADFNRGVDRYIACLVKELSHIRCCDVPTPKSYAEAIKGDFAKYWVEAIEREIANLEEHKVFEWTYPEPTDNVHVDSTWAFKPKSNDRGQISRFKARLCARGFKQLYGIDYISLSLIHI